MIPTDSEVFIPAALLPGRVSNDFELKRHLRRERFA